MTKLEHRDFDSLDHTKAKWWWVDSLDLEKYITFGLSGKHGNKIGSLGLQYHHTPHPKTIGLLVIGTSTLLGHRHSTGPTLKL